MVNIVSHFPESYTPTPGQVDTLKRIERAFANGSKFVICNAPTGSGKSMFAKTLQGVVKSPSPRCAGISVVLSAISPGKNG